MLLVNNVLVLFLSLLVVYVLSYIKLLLQVVNREHAPSSRLWLTQMIVVITTSARTKHSTTSSAALEPCLTLT